MNKTDAMILRSFVDVLSEANIDNSAAYSKEKFKYGGNIYNLFKKEDYDKLVGKKFIRGKEEYIIIPPENPKEIDIKRVFSTNKGSNVFIFAKNQNNKFILVGPDTAFAEQISIDKLAGEKNFVSALIARSKGVPIQDSKLNVLVNRLESLIKKKITKVEPVGGSLNKTDFIVNGNIKISFKSSSSKKGANLYTPNRTGTVDILNNVASKFGPEISTLVEDLIGEAMDKLAPVVIKNVEEYKALSTRTTTFDKALDKATTFSEYRKVEAELANKFKDKLVYFLESNLDFKKAFIRESFTGEIKYGKNSNSVPTHILHVDQKLGQIIYFSELDDAFFDDISNLYDIKIGVGRHTGKGGQTHIGTFLRMQIGKFLGTNKKRINENKNTYPVLYEFKLRDIIKKLRGTIRSSLNKAKNLLSRAFKKNPSRFLDDYGIKVQLVKK